MSLDRPPRFPENYSVPPVSRTRRPGNGFYQYINQVWMKKTRIPPWLSEYGASEEIEKGNLKELKRILKHHGQKEPTVGQIPTSPVEHVQFFSHIWHKSKAENEEEYVHGMVREILGAAGDTVSFARLMGWLSTTPISPIVGKGVEREKHEPFFTQHCLSTVNPTLLLKYYTTPSLHKDPVWLAYLMYINTCAVELGLPFLHKAVEAETELAHIFSMDSNEDDFKILDGHALERWVPELAWSEFMDGMEIGEAWRKMHWIINDPVCVKRVLQWLCKASSEKLVALCTLKLLNFATPYLRPVLKKVSFYLFKTTLRGITKHFPKEEHFVGDLGNVFPNILCSLFTKTQANPKKSKDLHDLVQKIRDSAVDTMAHNTSLSKHTTSLIIEKLHRMEVSIGSPKPGSIPPMKFYPDSILHTMMSIAGARNIQSYRETGKPPDRVRLTYPCFIVNASYYESLNHFIIPWGILHCPFYCEDAPLGWNYGGIGATIGHEITHAFDMDGRHITPRATYREWWTRKDRGQFNKKTRKIKTFFTKFKHYGLHLNGKKTLSENWADFGGLIISLNALKREIKERGLSDTEGKEAIRTFFISYAVSWRNLLRKKMAIYKIKKSVHSMGEDRVDRIVPQFQEWVDAFDIKKSDPLYLPPGERLKFF